MTSVVSLLASIGLWALSLLVLLGAMPMAVTVFQYLLLAGHRWRDHYNDDQVDLVYSPRVAVVVPAWNEAAVLRFSIDRMMELDYPADRLRLCVIDDGSTDGTPELLAAKEAEYGDRVVGYRRENGGQGKAHTLNHGLERLLEDDWAEAVMITDADVVFEPTSIRRMVRHLKDPTVGSVTAFIKEASDKPNWMNRYIAFEYCVAQAACRRAQNVAQAQGCLAGGAQMHTRVNLDALGGRIDTTTLAEDTVTTFLTQLGGRKVIFDGNAVCYAEEPGDIHGLWKQRLRWSRGNLQVAKRFHGVFFTRSKVHGLGGTWFGLMWWVTLLLPAFMVLSSGALVTMWFLNANRAHYLFTALWITSALGFVFTTTFALLVEPSVARRSWRQAWAFPGLISLTIMVWVLAPRPMHDLVHHGVNTAGFDWTPETRSYLALAAYTWASVCMLAAWAVYRLGPDPTGDLAHRHLDVRCRVWAAAVRDQLRLVHRGGPRESIDVGQDGEDREGGSAMTSDGSEPSPDEMLEHDRAVERRLVWKCLFSFLVVVVVILVRQRYLVA